MSTPDPLLDAMANGRALYQAVACRIWGRTALYQSSGAPRKFTAGEMTFIPFYAYQNREPTAMEVWAPYRVNR